MATISQPASQVLSPNAPGDSGLLGTARPGELDLFSFVLLLRRHLWRIVLFALVGFAIAAAYTYFAKPRYAATTTIIVPQSTPTATSLALQAAGGGVDLLGGGLEIYLDELRSRKVAAQIVTRFDLQGRWHIPDEAAAEATLVGKTTIIVNREGLLLITVEDEDPKLAADLANSYLVELDKLNENLSITSAGRQRQFFERGMIVEKNALADAEVMLQQAQEKNGTLEPQMQAQANVGAIENTRAQLRARQVDLSTLLQGATAQNPQVIRVRAEIASLEGQLQAMQSGSGGGVATGTPASRAPAQALAFIRAQREVRFHESLFEGLQRQYENAKGQEAKDISQLEVLDVAQVPRFKTCRHALSTA